jgi:hypothetical protein
MIGLPPLEDEAKGSLFINENSTTNIDKPINTPID